MTSGQVLAGWLLSAVSWKTIRWDDSIKGNRPARKHVFIHPASEVRRAQKEATRKGVGGGEEDAEGRRVHSGLIQGGAACARAILDTSVEHESPLASAERAVCVFCVYCVSAA